MGEEHDRDDLLRKLIDSPVRPQRHGARARPLPREGRRRRAAAGEQGDRLPRLVLRRRGRADHALRPAHGRGLRELGQPRRLAGDRVRHVEADDRARRRRDPARARGAGRGASRPRAGCSRRTGSGSAPSTTSRCCGSSASATGSRTTRAILEGRPPGSHPFTLLDYFPDDFVVFIDESHQTVPQIGGMYEGDRSRKQTLVDYGFRLPSALDNRPLRFDEFLGKVPQMVFVSATPGPFELRHSAGGASSSSARPGSSTPRSSCARRRTRSTTCSTRSAAARRRASACSSRR